MALPQPSIPYEPPQQAGPLAQIGQVMALRNQMQQGKALEMENQLRQQQVKDQQTVMQTLAATNGDLQSALPQLAGKVSPTTYLGLQKASFETREAALKMSNEQLANDKTRNDNLLGLIDQAKQLPPDQYAQQWPQIAQKAVQIKPELQGQVDPSKPVPQEQLGQFQLGIQAHSSIQDQVLKERADKRAQQAAEAELPGKVAESQIKQREAAIGTPQMQEAQYRAVLQKQASGQPLTPAEVSAARAYEASQTKTTSQSDSLGVTSVNTSKPSGLAALGVGKKATPASAPTPAGQSAPAAAKQNVKDSIVDLLGQYRADPQLLSRMMYKHPEMLGMVQQKYPDFDQTTYVAKNKMMQSYTSGTQSKEINAINTVAGHLSTLNDAIDALNNGNVGILNKLANKVGAAVGQTPQTTFQTIVHRIGPEITTAYVAGGGGEAERFANAEDFDVNKAPQQLKNNVGITVQLLRSKIGALENQYKQTVGRDDFSQRFITPDAAKAFNKLAPQAAAPSGGGFSVQAPNGKTYSFKDQQSLDNFKKAAGIQ
jgi:hypothetical protein